MSYFCISMSINFQTIGIMGVLCADGWECFIYWSHFEFLKALYVSVLLRETKVARQAGPRAHPTHLRPPMLCGDQAVTHSLWLRIMANRDTVREPPLQYITPTTSVQKPILSMTSSSWCRAQPSSSHAVRGGGDGQRNKYIVNQWECHIYQGCLKIELWFIWSNLIWTLLHDPTYFFLSIACRLDGSALYTPSHN
jgi:hypothetical protein